MKFYISFGQTHVHSVDAHTIDKDCLYKVEADNRDEARKKAFDIFGAQWAWCYDNPDLKYFPRGIINDTDESE